MHVGGSCVAYAYVCGMYVWMDMCCMCGMCLVCVWCVIYSYMYECMESGVGTLMVYSVTSHLTQEISRSLGLGGWAAFSSKPMSLLLIVLRYAPSYAQVFTWILGI